MYERIAQGSRVGEPRARVVANRGRLVSRSRLVKTTENRRCGSRPHSPEPPGHTQPIDNARHARRHRAGLVRCARRRGVKCTNSPTEKCIGPAACPRFAPPCSLAYSLGGGGSCDEAKCPLWGALFSCDLHAQCTLAWTARTSVLDGRHVAGCSNRSNNPTVLAAARTRRRRGSGSRQGRPTVLAAARTRRRQGSGSRQGRV